MPKPAPTRAPLRIDLAARALGHAQNYRDTVAKACRALVAQSAQEGEDGDAQQRALHGYAWVASYVEALTQLLGWARRLQARDQLSALAVDYVAIGFADHHWVNWRSDNRFNRCHISSSGCNSRRRSLLRPNRRRHRKGEHCERKTQLHGHQLQGNPGAHPQPGHAKTARMWMCWRC